MTPPSWVLSQMQLCFPRPHFRETAALTSSDALGGRGFTEQRLGASRTQEHSQDCAAADPQRLWLGASLPQKKFMRLCSSSISGIMESYNTHLAPGFTLTTLFQCQWVWLFSGVCCHLCLWGACSLYQIFSQQGNHLSLCGLWTPWTLLSALWDSPFPSEHCQASSCEFQTVLPCL